ncbi:MAG: sigma-70 family RNA polymerase sigma factor [Polyangiales bacterium]
MDNVVRLQDRVDDGELVQRAQRGDLDAKRQLFQRYVALASAIAFRLTGHDSDLEDIVQDSFIAAFAGLDRLAEPAAFRGWLASIVTRTAIATLRKRKLLSRLGLLRREPVQLELLTGPGAPADVVTELRAVYAALESFPAEERVTLLLRRYDQLSLEQIAEQTGTSLATVKRRLVRAEARLHKHFATSDKPGKP